MEQQEKNHENDSKIKQDLASHLERTAKQIIDNEEWNSINIAGLCQKELADLVDENDLANDPQTGYFCKFVSIATNFASMNFVDRLNVIPTLVDNIQDLLNEIRKEITEFAEIANYFSELITAFISIVMETQHNMSLALPYLEDSNEYLSILSEAFHPESETRLDTDDINDISQSLNGLSEGIFKLLNHAKASNDKSIQLDSRVDNLKNNIQNKIKITQNRIAFEDNFLKIGSGIGFNVGFTAANIMLESSAFGGAGLLTLGGLAFPPLGALLFGAAIGTISIGSIAYLCKFFWQRKNYKALNYLNRILENLNKLKGANLMFMSYMNKSEEESNRILSKLEYLKRSLTSGSRKIRKRNSLICNKAIESTNKMIKCIEQVKEIDINQWISSVEHHHQYSLK